MQHGLPTALDRGVFVETIPDKVQQGSQGTIQTPSGLGERRVANPWGMPFLTSSLGKPLGVWVWN